MFCVVYKHIVYYGLGFTPVVHEDRRHHIIRIHYTVTLKVTHIKHTLDGIFPTPFQTTLTTNFIIQ